MTPQAHTCPVSGFRLIPFGPSVGYHVGKAKYRQPSAAVRTADVHRQDWGRFDILGETFYVAENAETLRGSTRILQASQRCERYPAGDCGHVRRAARRGG